MARKVVVANAMSMHFAEVGKVQTRAEYIREGGGPYTVQQIIRVCGSWNRMLGLCRRIFPDRLDFTQVVDEVVEPVKEYPRVSTAAEALAKLQETKDE